MATGVPEEFSYSLRDLLLSSVFLACRYLVIQRPSFNGSELHETNTNSPGNLY